MWWENRQAAAVVPRAGRDDQGSCRASAGEEVARWWRALGQGGGPALYRQRQQRTGQQRDLRAAHWCRVIAVPPSRRIFSDLDGAVLVEADASASVGDLQRHPHRTLRDRVAAPTVWRVSVPRTAELRRSWPWADLVPADPRGWILDSVEPSARWVLLTGVFDRPAGDHDVVAARREVLQDAGTRRLLDRLPDWEAGEPLSGHESPRFAPNLLNLLADMGLRAGDSDQVDATLERMLAHQDPAGRFQSSVLPRGSAEPAWGSLLCDSHAVVEILVRYGHAGDPRVRTALGRMGADLTRTAQGPAWPCLPDPLTGFRGPGRRGDFCPQVTLEALRTFARLPEADRPVDLHGAARVSLAAWRRRATDKPYMFGHGKAFKTTKWPPTWYRALTLLDALGRYPALWRDPDARPEDRVALAELAACLLAYDVTDGGLVVPRATYRGFEEFSFGQKRAPSAFATAVLLTVLHRLDDLVADVRAVDVAELASSKGGTGHAVPPAGRRQPTVTFDPGPRHGGAESMQAGAPPDPGVPR